MAELEQAPESIDEDHVGEPDEAFLRNQDLEVLCGCLRELSDSAQLPEGHSQDPTDGSEVEITPQCFDSNDWIPQVLKVQQWFCLNKTLDSAGNPKMIVQSLFRQIPGGKAEDCYRIDGSEAVLLTLTGIRRLLFRVEKAVDFMKEFQERIESGTPVLQSTEEWDDAWVEENSQIRRPISDIHAEVTTLPIKEFREYARENKLDLNPPWQRDIVWSNKDSCELITSILRGIPLPSIILSKDESGFQIVDGKQRLTAILRFMGEHPDCTEFVKSKEANLEDFRKDFKQFIKKKIISPDEQKLPFMPFRLGKYEESGDPLASFSNKFYYQIKTMKVKRGARYELVSELFESQVSSYKIPVLIFQETQLQDIHQVFGLYNRQGKKLNAEELRNAMFHNVHLSRLLIVLSGDRATDDAIPKLVPFLPEPIQKEAKKMGFAMEGYGFGVARFKRTKALGWVVSILLKEPSSDGEGGFTYPSTAAHIDSMLKAVQNDPMHPMYREDKLIPLAEALIKAVSVHQKGIDAWPWKLRNKEKPPVAGKWLELPFVAAFLSSVILASTGKGDLLFSHQKIILERLKQGDLPKKSQNSTQWQFIAGEVITILDALELNLEELGAILIQKYGYDCLKTLVAINKDCVDGDPWFNLVPSKGTPPLMKA